MKMAAHHSHNKVLLSMLNVYQLLGVSNPIVNINGTVYQVLTQNSRFKFTTPGASGTSGKLDMVVYPSLKVPFYVSDQAPTAGQEARGTASFDNDPSLPNALASGLYDPSTNQRCSMQPGMQNTTLAQPLTLDGPDGSIYNVAPRFDALSSRPIMPLTFNPDSTTCTFQATWSPTASGGAPTVSLQVQVGPSTWNTVLTLTRASTNVTASITTAFTALRWVAFNGTGVLGCTVDELTLRVSTDGDLIAPKAWKGFTAREDMLNMAATLNATPASAEPSVVLLGRTGWLSRVTGNAVYAGQFVATQVRARSLDQLSPDENELMQKPGVVQLPLREGCTFVSKPYNYIDYGRPRPFSETREDEFETFQSFLDCDGATTMVARVLTCIGVEVNNNVLGGTSSVEQFSISEIEAAFNIVAALPTALPNDNHIERWAKWVTLMAKRLGGPAATLASNASTAAKIAGTVATMLA